MTLWLGDVVPGKVLENEGSPFVSHCTGAISMCILLIYQCQLETLRKWHHRFASSVDHDYDGKFTMVSFFSKPDRPRYQAKDYQVSMSWLRTSVNGCRNGAMRRTKS